MGGHRGIRSHGGHGRSWRHKKSLRHSRHGTSGGHSGGRSGGHIEEAEEAAKPARKRKRTFGYARNPSSPPRMHRCRGQQSGHGVDVAVARQWDHDHNGISMDTWSSIWNPIWSWRDIQTSFPPNRWLSLRIEAFPYIIALCCCTQGERRCMACYFG